MLMFIASLAKILIFAYIACLTGCGDAPEKITWELKPGSTAADIGWHPKDRFDIAWHHEGDIDFTYIEHTADGRTKVFHQRCWSIGASRIALGSKENMLDGVWAHFAKDVTVEEALDTAKKVLVEWDGGLRDPPARGELTLEQFREAVKSGTYYQEQWGLQGSDGGVIRLSFRGTQPRSDGLKRKCTLTFE